MEYKIYVGAEIKISKGFMKSPFKVVYCGMPNDKTFVLAPLITNGYQGFSPSIYYDVNSTVIQVYKQDFDVIEVTREYIVLAD